MIFVSAVFISSCSSDEKNSDVKNSGSSNSAETSQNADTKISEEVKASGTSDSSFSSNGKLSNIKFGTDQVPADLRDENNLTAAVSWIDKLGENLIVVTTTDEKTVNEDNRIKEFFVYHYLIKENSNEVLWKTYDFIKDCPFDITLEFIDSSLTVTDLDDDDIAETSFMYKLSCRSDVSPDEMKLIMHEGQDKYAIRGEMMLKINDEEQGKGKMDIDISFKKAPEFFRNYAVKQWNKFNKVFLGEKYEK